MDPIRVLGWQEVLLRLGVATVIGAILGINRNLRGKPAGLRTHALVTIGAALVTMNAAYVAFNGKVPDGTAASRVMQGIITGIGFLGAGVILRNEKIQAVHGLTTGASIWVAACLGIGCGLGQWGTCLIAAGLILFVLMVGGPVENFLRLRFFRRRAPIEDVPERYIDKDDAD
jgi:putative Mg2+ transporter-C (MgtC) family protein